MSGDIEDHMKHLAPHSESSKGFPTWTSDPNLRLPEALIDLNDNSDFYTSRFWRAHKDATEPHRKMTNDFLSWAKQGALEWPDLEAAYVSRLISFLEDKEDAFMRFTFFEWRNLQVRLEVRALATWTDFTAMKLRTKVASFFETEYGVRVVTCPVCGKPGVVVWYRQASPNRGWVRHRELVDGNLIYKAEQCSVETKNFPDGWRGDSKQ